MITAKEFLKEHYTKLREHYSNFNPEDGKSYTEYEKENPNMTMEDVLVEFAKLHVEAQAIAIEKAVKTKLKFAGFVNNETFVKAYPLTLIK